MKVFLLIFFTVCTLKMTEGYEMLVYSKKDQSTILIGGSD